MLRLFFRCQAIYCNVWSKPLTHLQYKYRNKCPLRKKDSIVLDVSSQYPYYLSSSAKYVTRPKRAWWLRSRRAWWMRSGGPLVVAATEATVTGTTATGAGLMTVVGADLMVAVGMNLIGAAAEANSHGGNRRRNGSGPWDNRRWHEDGPVIWLGFQGGDAIDQRLNMRLKHLLHHFLNGLHGDRGVFEF